MSSYDNTSVITGPSHPRSIFGVWEKSKTTYLSDATEVTTHTEAPPLTFTLPSRPPPTYTVQIESSVASGGVPAADASEIYRPLSNATISIPPPYSPCRDIEHQGVDTAEHPTLARMFFIYGFFFFPFWLAGIYILCSPLRPTPDWEAGKTESEKTQLLHLIRNTEKKWGRRCLYALFALVITVFLLFVLIKFVIMRSI